MSRRRLVRDGPNTYTCEHAIKRCHLSRMRGMSPKHSLTQRVRGLSFLLALLRETARNCEKLRGSSVLRAGETGPSGRAPSGGPTLRWPPRAEALGQGQRGG